MSDWTIKIIVFLTIIICIISFISYLISIGYIIYGNFYITLDKGILDMVYLY